MPEPEVLATGVTSWHVNPQRTYIVLSGEDTSQRQLTPDGRVGELSWRRPGSWEALGRDGEPALWRRTAGHCELELKDGRRNLVGRPVACRENEVLLVLSDGGQSVLCAYGLDSESYTVLAGTHGVTGVICADGIVVVNVGGTVRLYRDHTEIAVDWPDDVRPALAAGHGGGVVGLTGLDRSGQPVPGVLEVATRSVRWFDRHPGYTCGDIGPSGTRLLAAAWNGAEYRYRVLDGEGEQVGALDPGRALATDLCFTADERHVIGWHQSPASPPAVVRWSTAEPVSDVDTEPVRWEQRWVSGVPEWVFHPSNGHRAGTVLFLHGGPGGRVNQGYDPVIAALVGAGWTVVGMNYPGSSGYGSEYQAVARGDWGGADAQAIERRLRQLAADGPLCLYGHSYGGYLALLVAAAAPDVATRVATWAPVVDLPELLRTADGVRRRWLKAELGEMGDHLERLWDRSPASRVAALTEVRLLLGHGERDELCPVEQSRRLRKLLPDSVRYLEDPDGAHEPSAWRPWTDAVLTHFGSTS